MLVVVMIIVVLAGAGVPIYLSYIDNAKRDVARSGIKQVETAIMAYRYNAGQLPGSLQELAAMQPGGGKPYVDEKTLKDPWGNFYVYDPSNVNELSGVPLIYSNGPPGGVPISNRDQIAGR